MRYVCLLAVTIVAVCGLVPSVVFGQGTPSLSITNYQYVSEQRISQASSFVTYRADLVNSGAARIAVTASVSSLVPSIQVVPGQGVLHFAPVPANRTVTTLDTFTILVDRTVAFDFAELQWTFLAPVANAGPNRTAKVGDLVILDGSRSTNPSGFGTLMYNWKLVSTPHGSSTVPVLYWYDTVQPQFTVDAPGNYVISLTVSNGAGSDIATVTVSTINTPPVANAGANQTVSPGAVVTLNGSGSSDVDGDPLTFAWTMVTRPLGSNAVLLAPTSVTPVFTVDKPGSYDIRLVVNDGKVDSAPSIVTISTQNTPPVANAGPNQIKAVGALVQLDGSGSTDVDGDPLTYQWSLIGVPLGSTAVPSPASAVKPTFTADLPGTYVAQLIVNDGKTPSAPATVQITTNPPLAPTASAGPNQTVAHRTTVHLNGSGTDPQGLPLTYQWSLTSKPNFSTAVLNATIPNPAFVADMPGIYVAQLIVSESLDPIAGTLASAPSTVTITTTNTAPVANPGQNQSVPAPASVSLDGSGSSDADGDPLTYAWSFSSRAGSTAALSSLTAVSPTFFADVAGTYVVQLIVFDGFAYSSPATVTVTAGVKTITLKPDPLNLSTNTPGSLTVSLGSLAGPGGQIVFLDSSNGTIAAIQANVTVPEGLAGVNVQVMPGSGSGSTTITAIASGFTPGFAQVNVTPPVVTVALSAGTIGLTRTINGTLTLSSPAPAGGVSVTLTDPAGFVTFQPAAVAFAAGATSATFTATGAAIGSTTILAGAPGYNTGMASVTVGMLGAITLLSNVTVGPGQSVPFPVSLVTGAPFGGVTIALASSDTSKVTISPSSVTIPQGATTPAQQPAVSGVNLGSANISASAPGFFGDTKAVQVAATLSFQQQTLTIGVNGTQDLTLNLSGPAPASGLVVNISSSNPASVTVPTTVTFAATKTSVTVPVTGIAIGTSVIHASAAALADTTATVNVVNVGAIGLPSNVTVGLGAQVFFPVTLPTPAPAGGVTVSLASTDTSKLTISAASITIPAGQTAPATQPMITGVNVGTASITASATGYTAASQAVLVYATVAFVPPTLTITGAATVNAVLNLSAAAPSTGLTITLSSSNPGVASVPPTVTFPAGVASANVAVTSGTPGTTVIHASGTNIADATLGVTVLPAGNVNVPANLSLVLGQSAALNVSLSSAPSSSVTITLVSSDPSRVSISSPTVTIPAGQTTPFIQPQVTGLNIGTATISASAPGYTSGSTAVQVGATIAFQQPSLTITGAVTQNLTLNLSAAAPAGGLTINLSSSSIGVATVPPTVVFAAGATTASVPVTGVAAGSAVIHASNLPNIADVTANVTVLILGPINVPSNPSIGLSQTVSFPVTLSASAPSAVTVALASSDTSKVTISASSVTIAQGATAPTLQPTITGVNIGSATISATAAGYSTGTATVHVTATIAFTPPSVTLTGGGTQNLTLTLSGQAPAGGLVVNLSSTNVSVATVPPTVTFAPGSTTVLVPLTIVGSGTTVIHASNLPNLADTAANVTAQNSISLPATISMVPGQQAPFTITLGAPAPASGVTVFLSSSDTSKVTVVSGVFVNPGQTTPNATPTVTGIDFGNATVTATASGYGTATTSVKVTASASFFPSSVSVGVGAGVQNLSLVLSVFAPSGVTFTLNSSNTGVATVPPSVTIPANQNNVNVPVTPGGAGSTTITASTVTPNIANTTASVTVTAAGTIGLPATLTVAPNQPTPYPIILGTAAPTGGVTVALSSSDTSKVTISVPSVFIAAGQVSPGTQPTVTGVNYGTANINASASGYTAASGPVKVTATMSFASPTVTIGGITAQNVALNLSAPAPSSGLTVNLTSGNTSSVTVPGSVSFPANASTVNVLLTAVAAGSATITATAVAPGIANASTNVTVSITGAINLPASGSVGLGQTASFPVTLSSPAVAPVTIALASSDTSKVTLSTASVTIAAGQSAPGTQPTITGVNFGAVNISATASGYTPASSAVQVIATVVFSPLSLTMSGAGTQNLTLTLSAGAPAGGVIVNLSSSNTSAVTVPATVSFSPGSSVVTVPVTAIAAGSATIHASSLPNIADSTASVTVQGAINLPSNVTVPPGQQAPFSVTLATPAPTGGVTVSLTSSDTSKVGLVSGSVFFPEGQTTPTFTPTVTGVDFGNSTITATANGYGSATTVVKVTGTATFFPPSLTIAGTGVQNLSLTLSVPAPSSVTFTLSSSSNTVATVPVSVTIPANQNSATVPVTAVGQGSATITASTTTPNIANATAGVTVTAPGVITVPVNLNVGLSTSVDFPVTLGTPAPAGGVTVTLASSDLSKLTFSPTTVSIAAGQTTPTTQPKATGVNIGAVTITASAATYTSAVVPAQVTATVSFAPPSLTIVGTATQTFTLTLSGAAPPSGITVTLSSSATGVATVPLQLTFLPNGGSPSTLTVPVTGVAPGTAVIHVSATPFIPDTTANVTVLPPGAIGLPANVSVGPTQSVPFPVTLGTPAPAGGVTVTLASADTSKLTISPLTVGIAAGQTVPATQPTVTGVNYGTVNITASAPGYVSASAAVKVTAIMTFASPTVTITGVTTQNVALNLSAPAPAGGLTVNLTSSNPAVATVPLSVIFTANATTVNVLVSSLTAGPTTITATAVASTIANATTNVTVLSPGAVVVPTNATVGLGQGATLAVSFSQAPASNVTVALASSDTSKVTISPSSVTILAGQTTPGTQPTITGVNLGSANITATALGYTPGTTAVQVNATVNFPQNLTMILGTGAHNLTLNLSAAAPASGISVNLTSSNLSVATVPATITFTSGQTTVSVPVTPVAIGAAVIHAANLPNIADATANVTVAAPATVILPASPTVGLGASVPFAVSLASPAPVDLTIALASNDITKLTIAPASITILAGLSTPGTQPTITGVNLGSANITATGTGVTSASVTVQVNATMSFASPTVTITGIATQTVALNLSGAAPAGGLTINLTSSAPGVATVPASVNFAAGATSVNVLVTAVTLGSTTITASTLAPNLPNTTTAVTVVTAGPIGLPTSPTVGLGKTATFAVTLPQAAAAAVTVALSSTDTNTLTISPASVTIAAGQTTPTTQPTITGVKLGTATINASAPGYTSSSVAVQVNATVSFTPNPLTISGFNTQNLTLTLSAAAPAGGIIINLSSGTPATATVPTTVTFIAGATTVNVPVTGVAFGTTVIHASAPPNIADATANVTVQSAGAITVPASMSVGLGQSGTFAISLPASAAAPVTVTVASSDTSKVLVSAGPFTIAQGATAPTTQPQVTGVNIGSVTITASAPGYTSSTGTVQTTAVVTFAQPTVTITGIGTQNVVLNLSAPAPASGLIVNLSSATPGVATVPGTVTFPASATSVNVPVTSVSLGTAVIHASATPFIADATTTVTVLSGGNVVVPASSTLTMGATATTLTVALSAPAPSALTVTLASSDNTLVTVSPATVTIAQGALTPTTQPTIFGVKIGTANVTASAPGYVTGTTAVQVNATVSFTQPTVTITGPKLQNLTLTLNAPAPPTGLTVNVSSSNTVVATTPLTVTFAAGATTVNVPVTALTLGSTVIHASATTFIPAATANVTVVTGGPIGLPAPVTIGLGGSAPFAVTLPVASANAVTVTLTSADPTKVSVTPATVSIAAGQTTPTTQPVVHGINVGSAISVSAAAPGYTTASQTVTVGATVSWPSPTIAFTAVGTQNVTLTLSAAAPSGGLTVNVSSSNLLVATVPATATFAAGSNTATVPVTALANGSTVLHASGVNIPDSTATLTVAIPTLGVLTVTGASIGKDLQAQLTINLSTTVSGGPLQVTVSSSDGSKLVLGSLVGAGTPSMVLGFPVGSNSGVFYAQALAGSGSVTVTVSAPGYTSGSNTVTLTPSGFVMTGPTGVVGVASFPTNVGNTTTLTVMAGRLDPTFVYQETQGLRGGFSVAVPLSSSNTVVGKVSPASVTFTPADTAYTTTFTALTIGATTLSATTPTGFSTPAAGGSSITANVAGGLVSAPNLTVGQSLEVPAQVTLTGAPGTATTITLTSSDPTRLRFGISASDPGAGTIPIPGCVPPAPDPTNACKIVKVGAGQSHTPDIYFQALASTGSATYTADIPGFGTGTGTVTFRPSSILITGPFGLGNSIHTTSGSAAVDLTVESAMLDTSGNYNLQSVAAITGVPPVSVNVTSSNTGVGTITVSPVTIPAGSAGATSGFQPGSAGSATISVSVPTGFSVPTQFGSVVATVSTSGIGITQGVSIGKFLQIQGNFTLGAPAPAGLIVHLASSNTSAMLLSTSPTVAGLGSIDITMTAGAFGGTYYIQALSDTGTVTYTASAPGYAPRTGSITLTKSGVVVGDGSGGILLGNTARVSMAQLDPGNVFGQIQQLAGGHPNVSIKMATTIGTITTPVTISAGADTATAVVTGTGSGSVTATTPAGFTDSNVLTVPIFIP